MKYLFRDLLILFSFVLLLIAIINTHVHIGVCKVYIYDYRIIYKHCLNNIIGLSKLGLSYLF